MRKIRNVSRSKFHSKVEEELIPVRYDWFIRWKLLKMVQPRKSVRMVDIRLGGFNTLKEMYRLGFLTGQAKQDVEEILEEQSGVTI